MICLPNTDPNQFDLFNNNINFPAEPSTVYPPNMQDIMDELSKPGAFKPSPNLALIDSVENALAAALISPGFGSLPLGQQQLLQGNYNFSANSQFNPYTSQYNAAFPPLLSGTGGVQTILNTLRTHLLGVPTTIPGVLGSLGQANTLRSLSYANAGNTLQRSLGLGAIPDCGLIDQLMGLLLNALQPLIDLLAALLGPLFALILALLAILAAILAELLRLLDLLQQLLNLSNASQLLALDPCSLLYMAQQGSPGLNGAVNSGITWNNPSAPTIPTLGPDLSSPF